MSENLKAFLAKVSADAELIERLRDQNKAGFIAVAKELGIELTDADFPKSQEEMTEAELIGVNGGIYNDIKDSNNLENDVIKNETMLIIPVV